MVFIDNKPVLRLLIMPKRKSTKDLETYDCLNDLPKEALDLLRERFGIVPVFFTPKRAATK